MQHKSLCSESLWIHSQISKCKYPLPVYLSIKLYIYLSKYVISPRFPWQLIFVLGYHGGHKEELWCQPFEKKYSGALYCWHSQLAPATSTAVVTIILAWPQEGRKRKGWQKVISLDDIIDSMDMSLSLIMKHEFHYHLGDNERQGSLVCCSSQGRKELDMT